MTPTNLERIRKKQIHAFYSRPPQRHHQRDGRRNINYPCDYCLLTQSCNSLFPDNNRFDTPTPLS
jgi:hypothetical protein